MRAVFGMIGVKDVTFVRAEGVAVSPEHRAAALEAALGSIAAAASSLASPLAA